MPAHDLGSRSKVYPRVGGGNVVVSFALRDEFGLSPRGRGKRLRHQSRQPRRGSIPAWAGETPIRYILSSYAKVYPRVGGGNPLPDSGNALEVGLSPRGRGKPAIPLPHRLRLRSIPAWAGETKIGYARLPLGMVYPRVGGGNRVSCAVAARGLGLSPRGRGKPMAMAGELQFPRSIPAWAGETG